MSDTLHKRIQAKRHTTSMYTHRHMRIADCVFDTHGDLVCPECGYVVLFQGSDWAKFIGGKRQKVTKEFTFGNAA